MTPSRVLSSGNRSPGYWQAQVYWQAAFTGGSKSTGRPRLLADLMTRVHEGPADSSCHIDTREQE